MCCGCLHMSLNTRRSKTHRETQRDTERHRETQRNRRTVGTCCPAQLWHHCRQRMHRCVRTRPAVVPAPANLCVTHRRTEVHKETQRGTESEPMHIHWLERYIRPPIRVIFLPSVELSPNSRAAACAAIGKHVYRSTCAIRHVCNIRICMCSMYGLGNRMQLHCAEKVPDQSAQV
jgi:hypothetical protein